MGTKHMDRRLFLKAAGATAGAVAGIAATQVGCLKYFKKGRSSAADNREVPTTCELCPNKCSAIAAVEGGFVKKLNPNPENPKSRDMLCARGNAAIKQVYDPDRLKQPMIRVGARGEGKWKPVSWDEAFDFAAKKLAEVKAKHGPEASLWSSTEGFQEIFFKNLGLAFGSPNLVRHPTLCLASVNLAYSATFGTVPSFDQIGRAHV